MKSILPLLGTVMLGVTAALALSAARAAPPPERKDQRPADQAAERTQADDADDAAAAQQPSSREREPSGDAVRRRVRHPPPGEERLGPRRPRGEPFEGDEEGFPPADPGGPGRGFRPDPRFRLTPEQRAELQEILRTHFPQMAERIEEARRDHPEAAERMMRRFMPFAMKLLDADPEMRDLIILEQKLQIQIDERLRALGGRAPTEAERRELRGLLEQQFDARIERSRRMLADFERRIAEQRRINEQRVAQREALIDDRLDHLLRRERPPNWPE